MKTSTKLLIVGIVLFFLGSLAPIFSFFSFICLISAIALIIYRGVIETRANNNTSKNYRDEAQQACEKVTPKRKQDVTPPWEE